MVGQPPPPAALMGDIQPQRRQHVMERLRRRIEQYRRQHASCYPRHINNLNGVLHDQKQKTRELQQRFLDAKAKKGGKKGGGENRKDGAGQSAGAHHQQPGKFKKTIPDGNNVSQPKGGSGATKELASGERGGCLLIKSSPPPPPVSGTHGARLMDLGGGGTSGGMTKFSVEIVQQFTGPTGVGSNHSGGNHIQTNVTVAAVAGGSNSASGTTHHNIKTSDSPAPASAKGDDGDGGTPLLPVMIECKQEPELDLESCCSGLDVDGSAVNGGRADAFGDSLTNLDLMDESIDDLIVGFSSEEMIDYLDRINGSEFKADDDDEEDNISVATSNGDHKVSSVLTPSFGSVSQVVVPPMFGGPSGGLHDFPLKESSPAAQTLKQMAEQHQSKHIQNQQQQHHLLQQQQQHHQQQQQGSMHNHHHQLSSMMGGAPPGSGGPYTTSSGVVDFGLGQAGPYSSTASMQLDFLQSATGHQTGFGKNPVGTPMFGPFGGGTPHHSQMPSGNNGGGMHHHHSAMMMMKQQQESGMFRARMPGFSGLHGGSQLQQPSSVAHGTGSGVSDGRKLQMAPSSGSPISRIDQNVQSSGASPVAGTGSCSPLAFGATKPLSHFAADTSPASGGAGRLNSSSAQQMHQGLQQYLQQQHSAHQQLHPAIGRGSGMTDDHQQQHGSSSPSTGANPPSLSASQQQFVNLAGNGGGSASVRLHQQVQANAHTTADGQSLQGSQMHLQSRDNTKMGHSDPLMYGFNQQQQQGGPSTADQFRLSINQSQSISFAGQNPTRGGGMPPVSSASIGQHMTANMLPHHHPHMQLHHQHQLSSDRSKMQSGPPRQPQFGLRPPPPEYASRVPVHPGVVAPQPRGGRPSVHHQLSQNSGGSSTVRPNSGVGAAGIPPPTKIAAMAPGSNGGRPLLYSGGVGRPPNSMNAVEAQIRPSEGHEWRPRPLQHHPSNTHPTHSNVTPSDFVSWPPQQSIAGGCSISGMTSVTLASSGGHSREYTMGPVGEGIHMMSMHQQQQNQSSLQQQQHLSRLHAARVSVPGSLPAYQMPPSTSATSMSQSSVPLLSVATGPGHMHPLVAAFQSGSVDGGPSAGDFNDFFENGGFGSTDLLINSLDLDSAPGLNLM